MIDRKKKAILLVCFGTTYEDTRRKNLDIIEAAVKDAFSECSVYSAWSCERLIHKVKRQQDYQVNTVQEALEKILDDGIQECLVQPVFITYGTETERISQILRSYEGKFSYLVMGDPLLADERDVEQTGRILADLYRKEAEDSCVLLMGHGTAFDVNSSYYILNKQFVKMGFPQIMLGTIEEKDSVERLISRVHESGRHRTVLVPFLLTAGRHVEKDMLGFQADSWKSQLERKGYEVTGVIRGLGEYEAVRELYISHIRRKLR